MGTGDINERMARAKGWEPFRDTDGGPGWKRPYPKPTRGIQLHFGDWEFTTDPALWGPLLVEIQQRVGTIRFDEYGSGSEAVKCSWDWRRGPGTYCDPIFAASIGEAVCRVRLVVFGESDV